MVPNWFVAGRSVAVMLGPLCAKVTFASGRRVGFDDDARRVRLVTGVTMSPIVKSTLAVVSSAKTAAAGGAGLVILIVGAGSIVRDHPWAIWPVSLNVSSTR